MISAKSHSVEWLNYQRDKFNGKDLQLIEKMIKALSLVECLKGHGFDFIFKGGTSLMLILPKSERFSIDVDIILPKTPKDIESKFQNMIKDSVFDRVEEDVRPNLRNIPKSHYKFYFSSTVKGSIRDPYILLDILSVDSKYPSVNEFDIKSDIIDQEGSPVTVTIPSIDSILGDKLTAFAPTTIGISYGIGKELEINKQLFDIGVLFDYCDDITEVAESFNNHAEEELLYRKSSNLTREDALEDIFNTALIISLEGKYQEAEFIELDRGRMQLRSFVQKGNFSRDNAILYSARAAYLTQLIKKSDFNLERYDRRADFPDKMINDKEFYDLNRLKKRSTEIFHYWERAIFHRAKK